MTKMDDFYFIIGDNPCDVFIVTGDKQIYYKRCENEQVARAIVDSQNNSIRRK